MSPLSLLCWVLPVALASSIPSESSALLQSRQTNTSRSGRPIYGNTPVATACGPNTANVVCVNKFGSLLPPSYSRNPNPGVGYTGTLVPDDPSWDLVTKADFVVFDKKRGLDLLGRAPKIEKIFDVLHVIHEAPVYSPKTNKLYVAQDGPPGNLSGLVIDLAVEPPKLSTFQTDPITYTPNGAVYKDGYIYWAVMGNNDSLPNGLVQRPGIARMDPSTLKVEWLLNTYYGFNFAGPNDLVVDKNGDIWFTDTDYSYVIGTSPSERQIQLATYRFRPSTGEVRMVEDTLDHPNGINVSPNGKTLYITDSGLERIGPATRGQGDFYLYPIKIDFVASGKRNIYAYDVNDSPNSPYLTNKRVIFQSIEGAPDGLKVAANGFLVVASGLSFGVDILDPAGGLIARIQAKHPVENIAWSGKDLKTLWLVGIGGITRVQFDLAGPKLD
ncbi:MAG: hypothetical protein M1814_004223 [Vezdaea aestivalis]|nr:MAG: hypothetical protein M1814_004223 [Vezdaea aestivalis]